MTAHESMVPFRKPSHSPSTPGSTTEYVQQLRDVLGRLPIAAIEAIIERLIVAYNEERTVFLFGNGGSAALASHAACDLGKGTAANGSRRFRVLSLTDNVPLITAWANDNCYADIFAEQIKSFLTPGDVCFAISGSGNSPNVLNALQVSQELGGYNMGLTGFEGGKMRSLCNLCAVVPSKNMQHIEDAHVVVSHAIFLAVRTHIVELQMKIAASAG